MPKPERKETSTSAKNAIIQRMLRGESVERLADELKMGKSNLYRWKKEAKAAKGAAPPNTAADPAKLASAKRSARSSSKGVVFSARTGNGHAAGVLSFKQAIGITIALRTMSSSVATAIPAVETGQATNAQLKDFARTMKMFVEEIEKELR
jgi:transposase-like protein